MTLPNNEPIIQASGNLSTPVPPLHVRQSKSGYTRYRALLEAVPDAIVIANQAGTIVLVNAQAEELFGYRQNELAGQAVEMLVSRHFRNQHSEQTSRLLNPAERTAVAGLELFGLRKDGSEFPAEIRITPFETRQGTLISSAIRDISSRRRTEEDLRRLASIVTCSDDAIIGKTLEGIITSWNAGAERIYGYSATEAIGRPVSMLVPANRPNEIPMILERLARGEILDHFETLRVRKNGEEFPVEITASPIRDAMERIVGASTIGRDISERKRREQEQSRFAAVVESSHDAIIGRTLDGTITHWNGGAQRIYGYSAAEIIGKPTNVLFLPDRIAEIAETMEKIGRGETVEEHDAIRLRRDGKLVHFALTHAPIRDGHGEVVGVSTVARDITGRKQAEEILFVEKERAQVTLDSIGDAVVCTNSWGIITFLNVVAETITGWSRQDAAGLPLSQVFRIKDAAGRTIGQDSITSAVGQDRTIHLPPECVLIRPDGSEIPIEDSIAPIHDRQGRATGAVIIFRDVSSARSLALQIAHSAEHDFLTGLPNRMLLNDRFSQAIIFAQRHQKKVAVLFLDLDGFKHINDSLGHPVGDKLLQSVAQRLLGCVRSSDTVSRQGGDEFVVLLSEVVHADDAAIAARKILQAMAEPHSLDTHELHVTASIGASVYPDDGPDAETLIKNADTAMYQAKENGRQSYQFFESAMNIRAVERQSIEESLRRALERKEFALHYQPRIDLKTHAIVGVEALIRWTHPTRGPVSPAHFIPVAEDCGLILPIGRWVLREACRQARAWLDAGLPAATMGVNVSAMEFGNERFLDGVFETLQETGLAPQSLELELTESVLMKRAESAASILKTLRTGGVRIAIDDFGTGYSSLSYLRKFPIDSLKIDQSFVRQITSAPGETTIVTAIIGMGRSLNLRVVAEGVETQEELAFLQARQCDEAQGYYFSRPVLPEQFATLLKTGVAETLLR